MSGKRSVNVRQGAQGFQRTTKGATAPTSAPLSNPGTSGGFLSRIFKRDSSPAPVSTEHVDAVRAKYAEIRAGLGNDLSCKFCANSKLNQLMKAPKGDIICQQCSRGGEGDNFIKVGPWLDASPGEIRKAEKADKRASKNRT